MKWDAPISCAGCGVRSYEALFVDEARDYFCPDCITDEELEQQ
jgi:hypothetical protein